MAFTREQLRVGHYFIHRNHDETTFKYYRIDKVEVDTFVFSAYNRNYGFIELQPRLIEDIHKFKHLIVISPEELEVYLVHRL